MNKETVELREIWGKWLRLSHWMLALSTLALIATGWLSKHAPSVAQAASDWHYIVGSVFTIGLILRIWLLFTDKGMGHAKHLIDDVQPAKIWQMAKFYLSLGKTPLPRWFAHNPFWAPVYLFIFAFMLATALSGHFQASHPVVFGLYLPSIHAGMANIIAVFALFHIVAVVLHDLKGEHADVSAMINGRRQFVVKPIDSGGVHKISIDDLKSTLKKD